MAVKIGMPKRSGWQMFAALLILVGYFSVVFSPLFLPHEVKLDTGLVESVKNFALLVMGWLFHAAKPADNLPPAEPAPPQLEKDSLR